MMSCTLGSDTKKLDSSSTLESSLNWKLEFQETGSQFKRLDLKFQLNWIPVLNGGTDVRGDQCQFQNWTQFCSHVRLNRLTLFPRCCGHFVAPYGRGAGRACAHGAAHRDVGNPSYHEWKQLRPRWAHSMPRASPRATGPARRSSGGGSK